MHAECTKHIATRTRIAELLYQPAQRKRTQAYAKASRLCRSTTNHGCLSSKLQQMQVLLFGTNATHAPQDIPELTPKGVSLQATPDVQRAGARNARQPWQRKHKQANLSK
jgi:hypothetical protein